MRPVRLTLVSASPRRSELLRKLNIPFDIAPSSAAERWYGADDRAIAILNARLKVEKSCYRGRPDRVLLGADTIISGRRFVFGKPMGSDSAKRMLEALSGHTHTVITGICLSGPAQGSKSTPFQIETAQETKVEFRELSTKEIRAYLQSREWEDKAGAYAIQESGRHLVAGYTGDYDTIVGLPVHLINDLLRQYFAHCRFL